eukprot:6198556-Pleurochrysis_carterae.AAC.2
MHNFTIFLSLVFSNGPTDSTESHCACSPRRARRISYAPSAERSRLVAQSTRAISTEQAHLLRHKGLEASRGAWRRDKRNGSAF